MIIHKIARIQLMLTIWIFRRINLFHFMCIVECTWAGENRTHRFQDIDEYWNLMRNGDQSGANKQIAILKLSSTRVWGLISNMYLQTHSPSHHSRLLLFQSEAFISCSASALCDERVLPFAAHEIAKVCILEEEKRRRKKKTTTSELQCCCRRITNMY